MRHASSALASGFAIASLGTVAHAHFELRAADDVDAIRPLCVTASGPIATSAASPNDFHGGGGGKSIYVVCPRWIAPIVAGMDVEFEGADMVIVNTIRLFCSTSDAGGPGSYFVEAFFDGPRYRGGGFIARFSTAGSATQRCPEGQHG